MGLHEQQKLPLWQLLERTICSNQASATLESIIHGVSWLLGAAAGELDLSARDLPSLNEIQKFKNRDFHKSNGAVG